MELKLLRQDVSLNSTVFNQSSEQAIDLELTMPDYYPEISRILKCMAVPRISSTGINGQMLSIEGCATVTVIYADDEGRVNSFEQLVPFSKSVEMGTDATGGTVCCKAKCEYINCRAVTSRRLDIHGAIGIHAKIQKKKNIEIVTDVDCGNVMLKRGNSPATSPIGTAEKYLMVDEELELGAGQPAVQNIIRYDAVAICKECKIISGKVVVKGDICVHLLYCSEMTDKLQVYNSTIPYSQIIDIDGINENCRVSCTAEVAQLEINPRASGSGEVKSFLLNAKLRFVATACCDNDIPVVFDAFSTKYETEIQSEDLTFEKLVCTLNDKFMCKKNVEMAENSLSNVCDLWCDIQTSSSKAEENGISVTGNAVICMIVCDNAETVFYREVPIDFDYKFSVDGVTENAFCTPDITVNNVSYTILDGSNIDISIEMCANIAVYNAAKSKIVTSLELKDTEKENPKKDTALIIYYAEAGEQIWDIARNFNTSPDEIKQINAIETEKLPTSKTLLIPIV